MNSLASTIRLRGPGRHSIEEHVGRLSAYSTSSAVASIAMKVERPRPGWDQYQIGGFHASRAAASHAAGVSITISSAPFLVAVWIVRGNRAGGLVMISGW